MCWVEWSEWRFGTVYMWEVDGSGFPEAPEQPLLTAREVE